ncbi:hypothetical protein CXB51_028530 [Gossypium anomalum]|uniref:RING-type domain-containing protein n=1 Tax=Gossypium anomalum TaxID=47600 RepID=A0A8J6CQD7_9ROSI|nr:hypothetical protein CXB51_028530 [Gossypium anomalum]
MAALTEFLSHLYTVTIVFFTLLRLEVEILMRPITGGVCNSETRLIIKAQYLKLIEEMDPTIRYSRRSSRPTQVEQCTVCLAELEEGEKVRKLKCKHSFHKDCLDKWLQQQYWATCPLCRTKVLPDEIVANYHRLQNQVDYDESSDEDMIFLLFALHGNSLHRL